MIQADKILNGLVAERVISKKSVQDLLVDYMKKKAPIKGLLFYAIQGLDAPISRSLEGDDAYVILISAIFSLVFSGNTAAISRMT